jgi:hypothetical protein
MSNRNALALKLLEFADQSIERAIQQPSDRIHSLGEVDEALRVFKREVANDELLQIKMLMLGLFHPDYAALGKDNPNDINEQLEHARKSIEALKNALQ